MNNPSQTKDMTTPTNVVGEQKRLLNGKLNWIDNVIREYIGGRYEEMGLVADEVKTPTYSALKRERAIIFEELRQFNSKYAKEIVELSAKTFDGIKPTPVGKFVYKPAVTLRKETLNNDIN